MNKTSIKARASLKGYAVANETDTLLLFSKGGKVISVNSATNRIITTQGGKTGINFVTADTIDAVSKFLLK